MDDKELRTFSVSESLKDQRLDQALVKAGIVSSRSQGQKWIQQDLVTVNGYKEKASYKLQDGDKIEVFVPAKIDIELVPYDFPLEIIFEDDDVIVVNKPAGLVVHPAAGHASDTLVNALLAHQIKLSKGSEEFRPGLVHRIDKGTSGLLVLAKNEAAHNHLAKQFLKKTIHRRYWALCFSGPKKDQGTIEGFIKRDPANRKRFVHSDKPDDGKRAVTHFKVVKRESLFSLLELTLETGRTHQIRVHLSHIHCPIVGDDLYNGTKIARSLKNQTLKKLILEMERFSLHAKELGFIHPKTGDRLFFETPIPIDLHSLFQLSGFSDVL
ncbi:MAG: RluA family pseudouridine synthase [Bdellovibrionales bacterium]|nr:RluA family pseudouridine synthase [Bdellovibrionales bacterium]